MTRIGQLLVFVIVVAIVWIVRASDPRLQERPSQPHASRAQAPTPVNVSEAAGAIDSAFLARWRKLGVDPQPPADELRLARRLSLALHGSIPSLQQIRELEQLPTSDRISQWTNRLLADRRFADYFAERLARAYVPDLPAEPFFIFRRRRLVHWLSDQIAANQPYDELVRDLITSEGLWTDQPATNFITGNERDPSRLAARSARAFLGLRIDCAECHDHPFAAWRQDDFRGIADFFAKVELGFVGLRDGDKTTVEDLQTHESRPVAPRVPFLDTLLATEGRDRERFAHWVTHPENPYFAKAIVNRAWALMFGRALVEPVDDLEQAEAVPGVIDLLADSFETSGYDLRHLIHAITSTQAYRVASSVDRSEADARHESVFASFPLTRLRPEQVAGSLAQISTLHTIDYDSPLLTRFVRLITHNEFSKRYGDAGEQELDARSGNITQRLLMMNGKLVGDRIGATPFTAGGRIGMLAPADEQAIEIAYLVCLTRKPTPPERDHFAGTLCGLSGDARTQAMEDLFWALVNATEFSWNY